MTNPASAVKNSSLAANEPVYVTAFITWIFSIVGTLVLGHTDLVSQGDWTTLSTILVPVFAGLVLAGLSYLLRNVVTPAWKAITKETEKVGIPDELVQHMILAGVTRELDDLQVKYPQLKDVVDDIRTHELPSGNVDRPTPAGRK